MCTSLTLSRENRRLFGRVQLLVDNVYVYGAHVNELGICTIIANWEAAVRYRRAAAERTSRPSDSPGIHDDHLSNEGRRRSTERRGRARYNETTVQNDVAVRNDKPRRAPVVDTPPSRGTSQPGQLASVQAADAEEGIATLCYAATAAPFRVTAFPLCFFLLLSFSYSALVPHRFTVPLSQIAL